MSIDASAKARVLGVETEFRDLRAGAVYLLPQRIAVIAQGATTATYAADRVTLTSAPAAGALFGYGSPIHSIMEQLFPANGDGVGTIPVDIFPLEDDASGVAAAGDITPTVAATAPGAFRVVVNGLASEGFVIVVADTVATVCAKITAAVNGVLSMPLAAVDGTTVVDLTAKWEGLTGNDITISVEGPTDIGVSFAITQPTGGLVNPDIQPALDLFGGVWETMVINQMGPSDADALAALSDTNEGRWGPLVRRPFIAFSGSVETVVATAGAVPDARKTDRTNVQLMAPGAAEMPFVVAARQVARIAKVANNNPPVDYGSQRATGLTPGADAEQWDYAERDQAVKLGVCTSDVRDGVISVGDVVTFYHPTGEPTPAYAYVVDIVKLQNIIYNLDLIFATEAWDGAPLIPDEQPTVNPAARKPKSAKAAVNSMIDSLGLQAIISDPETAKKATTAVIDSGNPKRLNVGLTVQLSGNTNIVDVSLYFGFFFGTAAVVA